MLTKQEYGNEDFVEFAYDNLDRLFQKKYNGVTKVEYAYNANGEIASMIDYFANKQQFYTYDLSGRLTEAYTENINTGSLYTHTIYDYIDAKNLLGGKTVYLYAGETAPQKTLAETYTYGNQAAGEIPDAIYGVSLNGEDILSYEYDSLGRLTRRRYDKPGISARYVYEEDLMDWNKTNNLVYSYTTRGLCYEYEYDALGNITYVTTAGNVYEYYAYDDLSRLTRVNVNYDSLAEAQGLTSIEAPDSYSAAYTYDAGGNILTKKIYSYYGSGVDLSTKTPLETITYTYGDSEWKDLLTNYNGTAITYDEIGNPLNWRDGMTFTWENGRQLKSVTANGKTYTYKYNADGTRFRKSGSGTYDYVLDESGRIIALNKNGILHATYIYDESGSPIGMQSGTSYFWFVKNLQGDIIEIVNDSGVSYASYYYDEWGVPTAVYHNVQAERIFPTRAIFLYRGYVYDWETGLYYLNSRYYDPVVGRFINADGLVSTGTGIMGYNMFAYCNNNPVMFSDPTGSCPGDSTHIIDVILEKETCEIVHTALDIFKLRVASSGYLVYPVENPTQNSTTYYGHVALDFHSAEGNKVYAVCGGVVTAVENGYKNDFTTTSDDTESWGNYMKIKTDTGEEYIYAHMQQGIVWDVGDEIVGGQIIGTVGSTGKTYNSDGTLGYPHLHLEIRINKNKVDPYEYLPW